MQPRQPSVVALCVLGSALLATIGCASGGTAAPAATASTSAASAAPRLARGSANVIIESEIAASSARNALELIQQLRPTMFRGRNGATDEQPGGVEMGIYIDGTRASSRDMLTGVLSPTIREIRYINAADATTRFGTGHPLGAILVSTKR